MQKDKSGTQKVLYTSGIYNSPNTGLTDYVNTMNSLDIKSSKKYVILNHAGLDRQTSKDTTIHKGYKEISLFHEVKHPYYAFGIEVECNIKPCLSQDFIIFTTEKDRLHAIKKIPSIALKSTAIPVPITVPVKKSNNNAARGNNVLWFGMIKDYYKGINDAIELARIFQNRGSSQKVIIAGSAIKRDVNTVITAIQEIYPSFCSKGLDIQTVKKDYNNFMATNQTPAKLPVEFHLDVTSDELDTLSCKCQYLYKPEAKGFCDSNSAAINMMARGLITLSQIGYCTDKDYIDGVYKDSVILGRKYNETEDKLQTRLLPQEAFNNIQELECNKQQKDEIIKKSQDLINTRFNPEVVQRLTQFNINSISNEKFQNHQLSINNVMNNNIVKTKASNDLFYLRGKDKYNSNKRKNFVVREKMIQIKNIIHKLMAELNLEYDDVINVFQLAKQNNGFTNSQQAMYTIKNNPKKEYLKKFSSLFQYHADKNDILSPNNPSSNRVGLRTKRVLDMFGNNNQTMLKFLQQNTTQLCLE